MKTKKISPLLVAIIAFELIVAPTPAHAQGLLALVGMVAQGYASGMQAGTSSYPNYSTDMGLFQQQMTNQQDEYFKPDFMRQIPGFEQYLVSQGKSINDVTCATLRTSLHEIKFDGCSGSPSIAGIDPNQAAALSSEYQKKYEDISKLYRNYAEDSLTAGQAFGLGCMKNAIDPLLKGYFNARLAELETLSAYIETATSKFQEDARSDLNAIEENTAVLDGGNNEITNNVKSRRPDLFDFSKRFKSSDCNSLFAMEDFNRMGKSSGLNNINTKLQDKLKEKSGAYSGESYGTAHEQIVKDINNIATQLKNQVNLNFSAIAQSGLGGLDLGAVSSSESIPVNNSILSNLQTTFSTQNKSLQDELRMIAGEVGSSGTSALALVTNPDAGGFEEELTSFRSSVENSCLQSTFTGTNSISNILKNRLRSNDSSSFAMKNASNIAPRLEQIMNDKSTSMESKLKLLATLEKESGKRYFLTMDNTYEYSEVTDGNSNSVKRNKVSATNASTPSAYFSNMIKNCQAQFTANNLNNKFSGATAIKRMRELRKEYTKMRSSLQNNIYNEVRKKMISCESSTVANNSVAGSCSASRLDPTKAGFCANGAFDCANKMKSCNAKSQKYVDDIKADRTKRVTNYKNRVEVFRTTLNNKLNEKLQAFLAQGQQLNRLFGAAYQAPTGIQTQLPEGSRYMDALRNATSQSVDGELLLEDPAKYSQMIKDNINLLKASIANQQNQILGASSPLMTHVNKTTTDVYKKVAQQADEFARNCANGKRFYDNMIAEQLKQQQQLGEKRQRLCALYSAGQDNPAGFCGGNLEDLMSVDPTSVARLQTYCRKYNNNDENDSDSRRSAVSICTDPSNQLASGATATPGSIQDMCKRYRESCVQCTDSRTTNCQQTCDDKATLAEFITQAGNPRGSDDDDYNSDAPQAPAICSGADNMLSRVGDIFSGGSGQQSGGSTSGVQGF